MRDRGLPSALRAAIARFCEDVPPAELARRAATLSENYRARAGSEGVRNEADAAAYLAARLPATYAAMSAALDAVSERAPDFSPASVLDIGAGPGTASWAAVEVWPRIESAAMLDRNKTLLAAARRLAASHTVLREARIAEGDMAAPQAAADLVLAGYALAELSEAELARAVPALWAACRGVLVLVEPGTPDGFARILSARKILLGLSARIVAPCPGGYDCPIAAPDWCHFSVRLPRLRAHLRAKSASVPFEDEKFSYLAVAREGVALAPIAARVLSRPHETKPGVTLRLCGDSGISERTVPKRDKNAYRAFAKKSWGDAV